MQFFAFRPQAAAPKPEGQVIPEDGTHPTITTTFFFLENGDFFQHHHQHRNSPASKMKIT